MPCGSSRFRKRRLSLNNLVKNLASRALRAVRLARERVELDRAQVEAWALWRRGLRDRPAGQFH